MAAVQYFEQRQERERETQQYQYKSKEVKERISFLELQAQVYLTSPVTSLYIFFFMLTSKENKDFPVSDVSLLKNTDIEDSSKNTNRNIDTITEKYTILNLLIQMKLLL